MRNQSVDHELPVHVRHAAIGRAFGQTDQCTLDFRSRRFALGGTVEPLHESIVGFQIGFHHADLGELGESLRSGSQRANGASEAIC